MFFHSKAVVMCYTIPDIVSMLVLHCIGEIMNILRSVSCDAGTAQMLMARTAGVDCRRYLKMCGGPRVVGRTTAKAS